MCAQLNIFDCHLLNIKLRFLPNNTALLCRGAEAYDPADLNFHYQQILLEATILFRHQSISTSIRRWHDISKITKHNSTN